MSAYPTWDILTSWHRFGSEVEGPMRLQATLHYVYTPKAGQGAAAGSRRLIARFGPPVRRKVLLGAIRAPIG